MMGSNLHKKMRKRIVVALVLLGLLALLLFFASMGEAAAKSLPKLMDAPESPQMIEIEYNGKIISVDIDDLILMADGKGGEKVGLDDPKKYADQLEIGALPNEEPASDAGFNPEVGINPGVRQQEITVREYEEERQARRWTEIVEDLSLREIDNKALALVKEYSEAKHAVPPMLGSAGAVVMNYSTYTPKIVCRPMYVTDIILQPGEIVTGLHPGDPVRWIFAPSKSGAGNNEQIHVLIKPMMADISTNLVINTDRRAYHLDLSSSATDFIPSVSFSYPADSLHEWDSFIAKKQEERKNNITLASGYAVNPEDLYLSYEVKGKSSLRWKPLQVWDDGVKTYIRFKKGSTKKSIEAPVLVVYEHKKETLVNYRATEDMYIVDRVFDKAALIAGTGANQDRVVITRLKEKSGQS
jgi:type IV secretion system protein VirB9